MDVNVLRTQPPLNAQASGGVPRPSFACRTDPATRVSLIGALLLHRDRGGAAARAVRRAVAAVPLRKSRTA